MRYSHTLPDEDTFQGAIIGGRNWLPMTTEAIIQGYDLVRIGMKDAEMLYPHRDDPSRGANRSSTKWPLSHES